MFTPGVYDLSGVCLIRGNLMTTVSRKPDPRPIDDVGTLWTMRRGDRHARCALIAWPADWELRVLIDGETLLTQRSARGAETFRLAEQWRRRMVQNGWVQVVPRSARWPRESLRARLASDTVR
jgi:hypothetical protein